MGFFSRKQKKMAFNYTATRLQQEYHGSEIDLKFASQIGTEKFLKESMKRHKDLEYALLYKNTPEYLKKVSKKKRANF